MNRIAFTAGYAGHTPEQLLAICERMGGIVIDIRFAPTSRDPRWRRAALLTLFGHERYRHVGWLGNTRYKLGPPIEIANLEAGLAALREMPVDVPLILLCGCKEAACCHRTLVGGALREEGWTVLELLWIWEDGDANRCA